MNLLDRTHDTVASAWRAGWTIAPPMSVAEWADRFRVLRPEDSELAGPWRSDHAPWARFVMECYGHRAVRRLFFAKPAQVGGTEALLNCLLYTIDHDPCPMLVVYPVIDKAKEFNTDRLTPAIKTSPRTARHLTGSKDDEKTAKLTLRNCIVRFAGSGKEHNLETHAAGVVIVDELDRCVDEQPEVMDILGHRVTTRHAAKVVGVGTPGDAGYGVDAAIGSATEFRFWVPCPHCGVFHTRSFPRVTWPTPEGVRKTDANPDEAAAGAVYACDANGCVIEPAWNLEQQRDGVWISAAAGERIESAGRILAEETIDERRGRRRMSELGFDALRGRGSEDDAALLERVGVNIKEPLGGMPESVGLRLGLYGTLGPDAPYAKAVRQFVSNRGRATRDWATRSLGEAWEEVGQSLEEAEFRRICTPAHDGGYKMGTVPEGIERLILAVDVQKDRIVTVVRGFSADWRDTALVSYGEIERDESRRLRDAAIEQLPRIGFRRANSREVLRLWLRLIDSGHWTDEVYQASMIWTQSGCVTLPTKGVGNQFTKITNLASIDAHGKAYLRGAGLQLLTFQADQMKTAFAALVRGAGVEIGAGVGPISLGRFLLPEDTPDAYIEEVTAEHRVEDPRRGLVWKMRPGRQHNHALDCEAQILAAVRHFATMPQLSMTTRRTRRPRRGRWR